MPGSVTVSTASPVGVVGALFRLALAYFDRLSAGDWARASVVLRVFADTFNEYREGVVRFAVENSAGGASAASWIPASASSVFDSNTRRALQTALLLGARSDLPASYSGQVEAMPTTSAPAPMASWWSALAPSYTTVEMQLARDAAADSVATLAQNLESRVNAGIYGGSGSATRDERLTPFDEPDATPLPPLFITPTRRARFVMPTWGWWAIGLGGVAAFGVLAYGVLEQGWFQKRPRRRRR